MSIKVEFAFVLCLAGPCVARGPAGIKEIKAIINLIVSCFRFPGVVHVRGQAAAGGGRQHRVGGGARVHRRNGQRPNTRPVGPAGSDQLRRGAVVRVRGRLAAGRLHRAGRRVRVRDDRVRRAVPVAARVAVLFDAGRPAGRRGPMSVPAEELRGPRPSGRTR